MNDDAALLRRYVEEDNEEAFTALVQRHVDLVYSAALRRTGGDAHRAADVAQEVFTALARQARTLARHPVLGAWLHATTRNIAVNLMRSDQRRRRRQHTALTLETAQPSAPALEWEQVRPIIDVAIDDLPERDRQPVVMRFLECRPFKEIGAVLMISEDAARVRTDRALDKLRAALVRRGITSTATALGAAVSAHGTIGAPAGLATAVAARSLAAAAAGNGFLSGTSVFLACKLAATAALSAFIAFVLGTLIAERRPTPVISSAIRVAQSTAVSALTEENRRLAAELQQVNKDVAGRKATNRELVAELAHRAPPARTGGLIGAPLPRHEIQSSVLHNLRMLAAAVDQFRVEHGRWPSSIEEIVGATAYIMRIMPVDGEDYTKLSLDGGTFKITTVSGVTVVYLNGPDPRYNPDSAELRIDYPPEIIRARDLEEKVRSSKQTATEAYRLANQGKNPPNEMALVPFFSTPHEGADFVEYLDAKKAASEL